jgi:hypothetical protein
MKLQERLLGWKEFLLERAKKKGGPYA